MLGDFLRNERKKRHLTQTKLAKISGIDQTTISKIELNKNLMKVPTMLKLSKALNIPVENFLKLGGWK